jgi:hypothetical protein
MLPLALYLAFLGLSCAYALVDWRRGWLLVMICGVIQDPVRKLTPGAPVYISFAVVALFAAILFSARNELIRNTSEFARRFPNVYRALMIFVFLLFVAGLNGLMTYGFDKWKVPLVSLFTYAVPMVAAILGYTWLQREEMMHRFFHLYCLVTSIALVGTVMEYFRVRWHAVGMVAFEGDFIRHLPGIQIRLLSGFYRSPDVMAWHAGMLTAIAVAMALHAGFSKRTLFWSGVAGWGFFNCMIAGRRKAIYFVAVFCIVFVWRYLRRMKNAQVYAIVGLVVVLGGVFEHLAADSGTNVYARGAATSRGEVMERLEGGALETFQQFGLMGAGLGTATQGVYHLLGAGVANIGWQEGALGKLAIEVGLPGILSIVFLGLVLWRLLLRLTNVGDMPGSSQFVRVILFALVVANAGNFGASAQAYTDAVLGLTTGFLIGCTFASAALDERFVASSAVESESTPPVPALA